MRRIYLGGVSQKLTSGDIASSHSRYPNSCN